MRTSLLLLAVLLSTASEQRFHSSTELVVLQVSVDDPQAGAVVGLTEDRFTVRQDSQFRPIVQFVTDAPPISLAVAVDASKSMRGLRMAAAREAVLRIYDHLDASDELLVFGFNFKVFRISNPTQQRQTLEQALAATIPRGGTNLYGAVTTGLRALQRASNRRRALLVISDGEDEVLTSPGNGDQVRAKRAAKAEDAVRRSSAVVYAFGVGAGGTDAPDVPALQQLTDPSGGTTQVVSRDQDIPAAAERLMAELRRVYLIGFEPEHEDGQFHHIEVDVAGCNRCIVRTRTVFLSQKS